QRGPNERRVGVAQLVPREGRPVRLWGDHARHDAERRLLVVPPRAGLELTEEDVGGVPISGRI
ncbi:MAG: hypothetical protein O7A71_07755, partial [Chloroflexi bacterium]|nr:hypothetical protein [Chloroflexota bacterium]